MPFWVKTVLLGQEVHYYMVYIAYFTELNSKIWDCAPKRRICRENCKYAFDEWPFLPPTKNCQVLPPWNHFTFLFNFLSAVFLLKCISRCKLFHFSTFQKHLSHTCVRGILLRGKSGDKRNYLRQKWLLKANAWKDF